MRPRQEWLTLRDPNPEALLAGYGSTIANPRLICQRYNIDKFIHMLYPDLRCLINRCDLVMGKGSLLFCGWARQTRTDAHTYPRYVTTSFSSGVQTGLSPLPKTEHLWDARKRLVQSSVVGRLCVLLITKSSRHNDIVFLRHVPNPLYATNYGTPAVSWNAGLRLWKIHFGKWCPGLDAARLA